MTHEEIQKAAHEAKAALDAKIAALKKDPEQKKRFAKLTRFLAKGGGKHSEAMAFLAGEFEKD